MEKHFSNTVEVPSEARQEVLDLMARLNWSNRYAAERIGVARNIVQRMRQEHVNKLIAAPEMMKQKLEEKKKRQESNQTNHMMKEISEWQLGVLNDYLMFYSYEELHQLTGVSKTLLSGLVNRKRTAVQLSVYEKLADKLYKFDRRYSRLQAKNLIKELREEKRISQEQLAKDLGVDVSLVRGVEKQVNEPATDTWQMFSEYFGVWVSYLIGASDRRVR
ncbi:helix-turn-helix domain-containing protein [Fructobacillus sp. M1-13]|uniref:Helix-turn-helix domain-containing protein n=1 Tax=Fructobacillus papyriferae TaxID=2713171 RepID=A0ABS5QPC4_9LACO|nr:helix-turn-helix transcriptional regulator [Fructobacillus papyriferae]MBS9335019.1 helix-turn-helix domain-containing protein [Fructobacillus papyriferae]MCD2159495.1 helix-turn-helix domain-containing protein [Fructobacillus papyriferae]